MVDTDQRKLVLAGIFVSAITIATVVMVSKRSTPPKKKPSKANQANQPNKPPGGRDIPRAPREVIRHSSVTVDEALTYVGEDLAAKAIRDGRPVVFMVHSEDPGDSPSWRSFIFTFALAFSKGPDHFANIECAGWPFGQVLVGTIYQQSNGIWTATLPTPDLIYNDPDDPDVSIDMARRMVKLIQGIVSGTEEPAASSELTPEQAQMIMNGSSVEQAVAATSG